MLSNNPKAIDTEMAALGNSRALLAAGLPLKEPTIRYGPFVVNTEAEIRQAIKDYQNERFTKGKTSTISEP